MKNIIVSLAFLSVISISGCSNDDAGTGGAQTSQQPNAAQVSQAETMEQIWASQLDPAEKARRVQELLAGSSKSNER